MTRREAADAITLFVCGGPRPPGCTVPGCTSAAPLTCSRELGGYKTGTTCARPLCHQHAHPIGADRHLCPAHARLAARGATAG